MLGERFGRLVVVERRPNVGGRSYYLCRCDCGTDVVVRAGNLKSYNTSSCGCLNSERSSQRIAERNAVHGGAYTAEYLVWTGMKKRCYNHNHPRYKDYGGRGITVCERWRNSFENFFADMGPRPGKHYQLDRINNGGNYEPSNCQWTTPMANANNRGSV